MSVTWRPGITGPWRPTMAFVRSSVLAIGLVTVALLSHRPDLLVLGTPFAIITAWSAATRPAAAPTVVDRFGNTTLREGDATTWRARVTDADGIEMVGARMQPATWIDHRVGHGSVTEPIVDGRAELAVAVRSTRWGRRLVQPVQLVASSSWGAFQCSMQTVHGSLVTLPLPAVFDTSAPRRPTDGLVGLERSTRRGEGSEFAGVRAFAGGDRIRRINWSRSLTTTASAKASTVPRRVSTPPSEQPERSPNTPVGGATASRCGRSARSVRRRSLPRPAPCTSGGCSTRSAASSRVAAPSAVGAVGCHRGRPAGPNSRSCSLR